MSSGLVVEDITVRFGEVTAVDSVSLAVAPGRILALLGANGAGKSSLLAAISGTVRAEGTVTVAGTDLGGRSPDERARWIAHVPEGRRLFPDQTVEENLCLGGFSSGRTRRRQRLEEVYDTLPRLQALRHRRAGKLSGGEQQMVALGRGLMADAPALAVDELSLGLAPVVASGFADTLEQLRHRGLAILLVEQYLPLALRIADELVVLERGRVVRQGACVELRADVLALQSAYLGHGPARPNAEHVP